MARKSMNLMMTMTNSQDRVSLITVGTAMPDRDEGEVGYRQNLWLNNI